MFAAIGQYVGTKVITAILVVGGAGAVIWFWRHPEDLATIGMVIKYILAWLGLVLVLPWATFFVTQWVVARESNMAAALMLAGYVLIDAIAALVLMGGMRGHNMLTWMVVLFGLLAAGVYNLKVCEYHAERLEQL